MKPINTPVAIRMEFVGFEVSTRPRPKSSARGSSGTARAARSLLRRRLAGGAKRIEAGAEARGGQGARRPADAHRLHLLGDHRRAAARRAGQGR
jgi:hypothetical protein